LKPEKTNLYMLGIIGQKILTALEIRPSRCGKNSKAESAGSWDSSERYLERKEPLSMMQNLCSAKRSRAIGSLLAIKATAETIKCLAIVAFFSTSGASVAYAGNLQTDCVMDPSGLVNLSPVTPGVLKEVLVRRGDLVSKGQVIATMNSDVEAATVDILETRAKSTAALEAQEARLSFINAQLERARILEEQQAQSAVRVEEISYERAIAESQLKQTQTDAITATLELNRAKIVYENTKIRSPVDGYVVDTARSAGEYAGADNHVATIAQYDPIYVEAFVPVDLYEEVRKGMIVKVYPEVPFDGYVEARIDAIDVILDTASRTFGVRASLENAGNRFPLGHRCTLEIATEQP
jgi:RND family efflux transporter MFP subunit